MVIHAWNVKMKSLLSGGCRAARRWIVTEMPLTFYTDLTSTQWEVFFKFVEGSVSSKWCVNFCQSWLILCYLQIVCQDFSEYLKNSYFKVHLWLDSFDFYVLAVPEKFLLSFYINTLVSFFHCLSTGFIASAMDSSSAHRLGIGNN